MSSKKSKKKIYVKRIISDIAELVSDPVENIFISYDENKITTLRALIIGPEDTPYEDGLYFFTLEYPESYPFKNPSAKFETINNTIRFNPNLYEGGKVCLSILGTWSGPKWSSVQTTKSILLSIQSLLNENPIINEPGWENTTKNDDKAINYNEYIRFHNYSFALYHMIKDDNFFPYFNDIIKKHFMDKYDKIIEKLGEYSNLYDNQIMKSPLWNHSIKIDYSTLIKNYQEMYENIKDDNVNIPNKKIPSNIPNINI